MRSEMNFNGLRKGKFPRMRKRAGFSLIIVLIISILGLAMIAATMQMTVLSTGSGRVVSAGNTKYNFMQDAVQLGKAILKQSMDDCDDPPVYKGGEITKVEDLLITCKYCSGGTPGCAGPDLPASWKFDCWKISRNLERADLGKLGIAGNSALLEVKIYDMQYSTDPQYFKVTDSNELKLFPPSITLPGGAGAHTYVGKTYNPNANLPIEAPPEGEEDGEGSTPATSENVSNAGAYLIRATLIIDGQVDRATILDTAVIQANNPDAPEA